MEPDLHESTSPQATAINQAKAVAQAMAELGGSGTIEEISKAAILPKDVVFRRLRSCSQKWLKAASGTHKWPAYFRCNPVAGVWTLTEAGKRFAEQP